MADTARGARTARRRLTPWLIAGAVASLLLPLLGLIYLRTSDNAGGSSHRSFVFERRESGDRKVQVSPTASIAVPSGRPAVVKPTIQKNGDSLNFIKPSKDYYQQESPAATEKPEPPPPASQPQRAAKKNFSPPKLKGTKPFRDFNSSSSRQTKSAAGKIAEPGQDGDMRELLKDLPAGAEKNPELRKLLNAQ